jgi:transaldolase
VQAISPLVGDARRSWLTAAIPKSTAEGLKAAQRSVAEGIRVNMTLCFSQQQAAAVYAATKGSRAPVYVSPFVGRLDDIGQNGVDLIRNIKRMFDQSDHHVLVLAASIRNLQHLLYAFHVNSELVTVPAKILEQWAKEGMPLPGHDFAYKLVGAEIPYEELNLEQLWERFNIEHELTRKGIQKFVSDYKSTLRKAS